MSKQNQENSPRPPPRFIVLALLRHEPPWRCRRRPPRGPSRARNARPRASRSRSQRTWKWGYKAKVRANSLHFVEFTARTPSMGVHRTCGEPNETNLTTIVPLPERLSTFQHGPFEPPPRAHEPGTSRSITQQWRPIRSKGIRYRISGGRFESVCSPARTSTMQPHGAYV